GQYSGDNIIATLKFANGSLFTITYLANGDRSASKERVEVFGGGSVAMLEDFRYLELVRHGRKRVMRSRWSQDKGHKNELRAFIHAVASQGAAPIPFEQIVGSTLATLRLKNSCQIGTPQTVALGDFVSSALEHSAAPKK